MMLYDFLGGEVIRLYREYRYDITLSDKNGYFYKLIILHNSYFVEFLNITVVFPTHYLTLARKYITDDTIDNVASYELSYKAFCLNKNPIFERQLSNFLCPQYMNEVMLNTIRKKIIYCTGV